MEANQDAAVIDLLRQHFSKVTPGDADLVWKGVRGYSFEDSQRAIEEHHRERGAQAYRPDVKRISALAANYYRSRTSRGGREIRIVDFIRQSSKLNTSRIKDADLIQRHFGECWGAVKSREPHDEGTSIARAYVMRHATDALTQIGWSHKEADECAHIIVGLEPGEKIPKQGLFNIQSQAKTSWEALKDLAVATKSLPSPETQQAVPAA